MIVKVQLPLMSNRIEQEALVYNESQSVYFFLKISIELLDAFKKPGNPNKRFFNARKIVKSKEHLHVDVLIEQEVPDPGW